MSRISKHIGLLNYLKSTYLGVKKPKINMNNFNVRTADKNDKEFTFYLNKGDRTYMVFDNKQPIDMDKVGYINYVPSTGQVGLLWLDREYRGHGIGKYMIDLVAKDAKKEGHENIFGVTNHDNQFIKNLPNSKWKDPAGKNVTMSGYSIPVEDILATKNW